MHYIQLLHNGALVEAELATIKRDLINVNCNTNINFEIGDTITCFYAKRRFETRVIQIHQQSVYLFPTKPDVPLQKMFDLPMTERRQHPRYEVNMHAIVFNDLEIVDAQIVDLSRSGLGMLCNESFLKVNQTYNAMIQYADLAITPKILIKNESELNGEFRYGVEIVSINSEDATRLQFFILSRQLNLN